MSFSTTSYVLGQYYRAFITTIDTSNNLTTTYSEVMTNTVDTVEVWFYNADGWSGVRAHVWDNGTAGTTWPGVAMTQEFESDGTTPTGWWYTSIPIADTDSGTSGLQYSFNVVFNDSNNDDNKTQDIALDETTGLYVTANGEISTTKTVLYLTNRVYFYKPDWLDTASLYVWGGTENDSGSFPGSNMIQENDTNWYYYDVTTATTSINYIISGLQSSTTKQSVNIEDILPGQTLYYTINDWPGENLFSVNQYTEKPADPV
jgi:hypothetical protein